MLSRSAIAFGLPFGHRERTRASAASATNCSFDASPTVSSSCSSLASSQVRSAAVASAASSIRSLIGALRRESTSIFAAPCARFSRCRCMSTSAAATIAFATLFRPAFPAAILASSTSRRRTARSASASFFSCSISKISSRFCRRFERGVSGASSPLRRKRLTRLLIVISPSALASAVVLLLLIAAPTARCVVSSCLPSSSASTFFVGSFFLR